MKQKSQFEHLLDPELLAEIDLRQKFRHSNRGFDVGKRIMRMTMFNPVGLCQKIQLEAHAFTTFGLRVLYWIDIFPSGPIDGVSAKRPCSTDNRK